MSFSSIFIFVFAAILFANANAQQDHFVPTENLPVAENRWPLTAEDLAVEIENPARLDVTTEIISDSITWHRYDDILLIPKARIKVIVKNLGSASFIRYKDQTINFQQSSEYSYTELYVSLFESQPVQIRNASNIQASIKIKFLKTDKPQVLVDYTCSRNGIEIEGLTNEHISVGCRTKPIGKFGNERPLLEIIWMSPELRIKSSTHLPYRAVYLSESPIQSKVENIYTGQTKTLSIKASIPKRLHRLFTAYGFGPYTLNTELEHEDGGIEKKSVLVAPALMFYANYKISETSSIRGFEALVFKESIFSNTGIYLGSDFGFNFDNKLYFTTLLGMQHLYFQFDKNSPVFSEPIFPQGIEFMYRHAFGVPNYIISGGIFLSPSETLKYTNAWIRWGKGYFWELNLISWGKAEFKATTYGLSVGLPFKGFL